MTKKKADFSLLFIAWDLLIILLSLLGDGVILLSHASVFLFKRVRIIIFNLYKIVVFILQFLAQLLRMLLYKISTNTLNRLRIFTSYLIHVWTRSKAVLKKNLKSTAKISINKIKMVRRPLISPPHLQTPKFSFHLPKPNIPRPPGIVIGIVLGTVATILFVFIPYNLYIFIKLLPNPRLLSQRVIPVTSQIFDRNGTLLYEIHGDEDRKPLTLTQIPDMLKKATIAIEDKEFYRHPGFSVSGIARAARENIVNHRLEGGSTITQQLIKNSLLTSEITYWRKLREVVLAFWAEHIYTKDQILEMYLNQVPYGGTAWGIEAAAETYFGKKVGDLNLAEDTYLAGLPAAPTLYSPHGSHPELAKVRQEEVLKRMQEEGYVTNDQVNQAKSTSIMLKPQTTPIKAPHFVMYIRELLSQKYGTRLVDQGGLRIITSLDLPTQEKVQEIITNSITDLTPLRVGNGAAVVANPKSGEILAMVGSKDYFNKAEGGNVNVTLAPRQPGSSIKAVTYTAALENGLTAASLIDDTPVAFPIPGQLTYTPVNYDGRFHGRVTLRSAFANSYNVPAVKVLSKIGVASMIDMGQRMGISTWNDKSRFGLSLTLGGGEVTLLDMTTVYGVLANGGNRVDLDPFIRVSDFTGRIYYEKGPAQPRHVTSAEIAFIVSDILSDNRARTPAFGLSSALVIPNKTVSVKTGTTNDKRDNWTIGYTPSVVVGVWVGNNDNSPMDPVLTSGVTGASSIWNKIMSLMLKDKPNEPLHPTPNIINIPCFGRSEYFIRGTEPKGGCVVTSPLPTVIPLQSPTI